MQLGSRLDEKEAGNYKVTGSHGNCRHRTKENVNIESEKEEIWD